MRQIGILPAGLNCYTPLYLTHISSKYFYYASTVAVYVYDTRTFSLLNVITVGENSITSFCVSPLDENILLIACVNGYVCCYNVQLREVVNSTQMPPSRTAIILSGQHDSDVCVMIDRRIDALNRVTCWVYRNEDSCKSAILRHKILEFKEGLVINAARWHPHVRTLLALGCSTGEIYLFNYTESTKKIFCAKDREATPIIDIQWDRLSSLYLLVAYSNYITLLDTETQAEINVFDKQPAGITSIVWLDWTAGNFVSSNSKNGSLKIWNASQKSPLETIRVGDVGIKYLKLGPGTKQCVCANVDGSVMVYHLEKRHIEFKTSDGHTETIFDCRLSPHSPDVFATASFDTTLKIWNSSDLSVSKTITGADAVLYSLAWSPTGNCIAASTSSGSVIVWSVDTGKELARYCHHTKASFCVQWNSLHRDILCSTSSDFSIVIFQVNEEQLLNEVNSKVVRGSHMINQKAITESKIKMRVMLTVPVFGVHFCPTAGNLLIVGAHDGNVRIFDYLLRNPMICILKGHTARVFNCVWSPLVAGLIASGSDDKNVLVWKVDVEALDSEKGKNESGDISRQSMSVGPVAVLKGHEMNVRAIQWNTEFKNILLTGSWDCTIRIWNTDSAECLECVKGHAADVYSLVAHPDRPFSYLSCSRDSTIRMWELEGPVRLCLAQSIWSASCESSRSVSEYNPYALSGKNSLLLSHKLGSQSKIFSSPHVTAALSIDDRIDLAKKYYELFNFYCGNNGSLDVWECALSLLNTQKSNGVPQPLPASLLVRPASSRVILTRHEILSGAESDAVKCDSVKMSARGEHMSEKTKHQLREAASLYARAGNYTKFCSIMCELGHYNEALAVAPCVSMDYWRELSLVYAAELAKKSSDMCVPFYIGAGKVECAIDFYLQRHDMRSALIIGSKADSSGSIASGSIPSVRARTPPRTQVVQVGAPRSSAFATEINATVVTAMNLNEPKQYVKAISHAYADVLVLTGKSIHAAAQHLSVGNVSDALRVLNSSGEYELALALAACLQLKDTDEIKCLLAQRVADQGDLRHGLEILDSIQQDSVEKEKYFMINRFFRGDEAKCKSYADNNALRSYSSWRNLAGEAEIMASDGESVVPLVICHQFAKAVTISLSMLRNFVRDPLELTSSGRTILRSLKFVRASLLDERLKASFLMHMLWFCGHEAAELGLWTTAACMLNKLAEHCRKNTFPISEDQIKFQEIFFRIFGGEDGVAQKLGAVISDKDLTSAVGNGLKNLHTLLQNVTVKYSISVDNKGKGRDDSANIGVNVFGSATSAIRDEVVRLGDSMSLPSLMKFKITRPGNGSMSVVPGSLLPFTQNKSACISCISGDLIIGPAIKVDSLPERTGFSESSYASISEVVGWLRVNPFEPNMSGEWISSKVYSVI